MTALYHLRGVEKRWPGFQVAAELLAIEAGAAAALVGPSGSGKSTLLDLLAFALKPDAAERFTFDGADIVARWANDDLDGLARLRGQHCGYVPQTGGLLPYLTVGDNIALTQRIAGRPDAAFVAVLAERLGIADQLGKRPAALSVGQRQRAAIARALAHRPRIVLADEPTAAVDAARADEIMGLLVEQARDLGTTLLVATHDLARVAAFDLSRIGCRMERGDGFTRACFDWERR